MKTIRQNQISECGLACLAMVAWHHGQENEISELRSRFPASLKGISLSRLMAIASELGLASRAVRLEPNDLQNLSLPAILHWDMKHYVVLEKIQRNGVVIRDPAAGKLIVSRNELESRFTGIAVEFSPLGDFNKKKSANKIAWSDITGRIRGVWPEVAKIVFMSAVIQLCLLLIPIYMQVALDHVVPTGDEGFLVVLALAFVLLACFQAAATYARGWLVIKLSSSIGLQWGVNVFAHLIRLPLDFFEKRSFGEVVSRIGSVQHIQRTLTTSSIEAVLDGFMAAATCVLMIIYSPTLFGVVAGTVIVLALVRVSYLTKHRSETELHLQSQARQHSFLLESLRGIQTLKTSVLQQTRTSSYSNVAAATIGREAKISKMTLGFVTLESAIFGIEKIIVIFLGVMFVLRGAMSVGMLVAFVAYRDQFSLRISSFINRAMEFGLLRVHAERIHEVVGVEPESSGGGGSLHILDERAVLQIDGLSYRYGSEERRVIDNCSLLIEPGTSLAIVGPSGAGKSTLVKLLLGLYLPEEGRIAYGGQDIAKLGLHNWRRIVGSVLQDEQLYTGTVYDNIMLGCEDRCEARARQAASVASVAFEIEAMPMSYNTLIGDMGAALSSGQKQRVLLARALYKEPKVLILDEATSHLDEMNEAAVNAAIARLNITRIIVAHRPSTIASADRIVELADGRLHEVRRRRQEDLESAQSA